MKISIDKIRKNILHNENYILEAMETIEKCKRHLSDTGMKYNDILSDEDLKNIYRILKIGSE